MRELYPPLKDGELINAGPYVKGDTTNPRDKLFRVYDIALNRYAEKSAKTLAMATSTTSTTATNIAQPTQTTSLNGAK